MALWFRRRREAKRWGGCAAVVAAAGASRRMGGRDKLMETLGDRPVLAYTLTALQQAKSIREIVVAAREDTLLAVSDLCRQYGIDKCTKVIRGGDSRAHSVLLAALEVSGDTELIAVQDGARPLTTPDLIDAAVAAAVRLDAVAPAVALPDTVKTVAADGTVLQTLDRETLRAVQTPQVFQSDLLKAALQSALEAGETVTDDCAAVERLGKKVYLIAGDGRNVKITTPIDLAVAEALMTEGWP